MILLRTSQAAKRLNITPAYLRILERQGKVEAIKSTDGCRMFLQEEIERFAGERQKKVTQKKGPTDD